MILDIRELLTNAREAGEKILEIYNDPQLSGEVDYKGDDSPLTLADTASNKIIVEFLKKEYPDIPIISEEGKDIPFEERENYEKFWLVDPLDGTKEFISGNGEFTVNIALIEDGFPNLGVVYLPTKEITYYAFENHSFIIENGSESRLKVAGRKSGRVAVRSRSHASAEEEQVFKRYGVSDFISRGSSLKFCEVASGNADIYYRHGPTMEWDTAAGQAILEGAGGRMFVSDKEDERFFYNKPSLLNPGFLCLGF